MKYIKKYPALLRKNVYHITEVIGLALVLFSVYQMYKPLAGIVFGVLLIVVGLSSPHKVKK